MMLDLFDDGAHALDDGLGAMLELTCYALMTSSHDGDDLMMPWGHDADDSDGCLMMSFGHGDDMMMSWLGDMIQWRLLDEFRPSYDMMLLLVMRYPIPLPFHSPHLPFLNPSSRIYPCKPSHTLPIP